MSTNQLIYESTNFPAFSVTHATSAFPKYNIVFHSTTQSFYNDNLHIYSKNDKLFQMCIVFLSHNELHFMSNILACVVSLMENLSLQNNKLINRFRFTTRRYCQSFHLTIAFIFYHPCFNQTLQQKLLKKLLLLLKNKERKINRSE